MHCWLNEIDIEKSELNWQQIGDIFFKVHKFSNSDIKKIKSRWLILQFMSFLLDVWKSKAINSIFYDFKLLFLFTHYID